ncbi:MAG: flavodoxin-dependent (E)-4-hydroxy-3-methylbut-2-enyl-diphosphate synthase [Candidatus Saganbacteria bacterium]|nr:flavodoxin-dependent (E)-4-hydroxy-3-methylbut-2-enyl-diphosphate synthase [Candidatus Saganbacteria bacterium]
MRRQSKTVKIGDVVIGDGAPVAVQSMTRTLTSNVDGTVEEIKKLEKAGCHIVRVAVTDEKDAKAISDIKKRTSIPLVADIHFNYKLALFSIEAGADKIRINPGNIGSEEKIKEIVSACKERKIPIRIGVNSGSLEKEILLRYKHVTPEALVESALENIKLLERMNFTDIVISVKSTSVPKSIEAYRLLAKKTRYPLHVGITESGFPRIGIVRSAVGLGILLHEGIGDTIRVSLTGSPEEEVRVALEILKSLELLDRGITIISCPTCGRCDIDVQAIAEEVEEKTRHIKLPLRVAIMGCEVNGPGEAADADVGVAGGRGVGLIFREGQVVRKVPEAEMVEALLDEIESMAIK